MKLFVLQGFHNKNVPTFHTVELLGELSGHFFLRKTWNSLLFFASNYWMIWLIVKWEHSPLQRLRLSWKRENSLKTWKFSETVRILWNGENSQKRRSWKPKWFVSLKSEFDFAKRFKVSKRIVLAVWKSFFSNRFRRPEDKYSEWRLILSI